MGGERETVSPQVVSKKGKSQVVGHVRYHEKGGEVHFHDDAAGLKVAVPVDLWMKTFQEMAGSVPAKRELGDPSRGTILHVAMKLRPKRPKFGITPKLVTTLRVEQVGKKKKDKPKIKAEDVTTDEVFSALKTFTYGR